MRALFSAELSVSDETYVELVRSLAGTLANTTVFGALYILLFAVMAIVTPEPLLLALGGLGVVLAVARLLVLLQLRRSLAGSDATPTQARRAERRYGAVYLAFALVFGLFAGHAFLSGSADLRVLVTALVVGYAAGVAAGLSLRPWISLPSMLLAVLPVAVAAAVSADPFDLLLALVLAVLLAGAVANMLCRFRSETEKISMRQLFATLARQDHLTGLANRLALADAYSNRRSSEPGKYVAVHCLDLDGFKQVNDRYGHPVGDLLLQNVAERLKAAVRKSDVTARLGGDEFVVLQMGLAHPSEAELMARRLVRTLCAPYAIEGHRLNVGVSVGYSLAGATDGDLPRLIESADEALYRIKRQGGGAAPALGNVVRLAG